jgi:hypothetical protein
VIAVRTGLFVPRQQIAQSQAAATAAAGHADFVAARERLVGTVVYRPLPR